MQIVALQQNRVCSGLTEAPLAVACGYFDAIHRGHRALIARAVDSGYVPCVMTFDENFYAALGQNRKPIYDTMTRRDLLVEAGVRYMLVLPSDDETIQCAGDVFVQRLFRALPIGLLVCGSDFRYGKQAAWDATALREQGRLYGADTCIVPLLCDEQGQKYSTGSISRLLQAGRIVEANEALGHLYRLHGIVKHGRGLGHTIGRATANFAIDDKLIVPKMGVYAARVSIDGRTYAGICNVGAHPTVQDMRCNVETHIIGYSGDLYGRDLTVCLGKYLRDIDKFDNVEALCVQLDNDCLDAIRWMETYD